MEYQILKPPPRRRRTAWIVAVVVVAAAVGAGAYVLGRGDRSSSAHTSTTVPPPTASPATPLTVVSTVPADGAKDVPSDQVLTVTLSASVASATGLPQLTPPVSGTWTRSGAHALTFAAAARLRGSGHERNVLQMRLFVNETTARRAGCATSEGELEPSPPNLVRPIKESRWGCGRLWKPSGTGFANASSG